MSGGKRGLRPWMVWGGGGAIAVIAVVVVLVVTLGGGDKAGESPEGTATAFAEALSAHDVEALNELFCYYHNRVKETGNIVVSDDVTVETVSSPSGTGNASATFGIAARIGDGYETNETFQLRLLDGKWCVASNEPVS